MQAGIAAYTGTSCRGGYGVVTPDIYRRRSRLHKILRDVHRTYSFITIPEIITNSSKNNDAAMKVEIALVTLCVVTLSTVVGSPVPQNPQVNSQPIIPYSYAYEVQDPIHNNYQNKAEVKTETGDVFGSYSLLHSDGLIYTVTYNSTAGNGFQSSMSITDPNSPNQSR